MELGVVTKHRGDGYDVTEGEEVGNSVTVVTTRVCVDYKVGYFSRHCVLVRYTCCKVFSVQKLQNEEIYDVTLILEIQMKPIKNILLADCQIVVS